MPVLAAARSVGGAASRQAIEAKEGVEVRPEASTAAEVTFQAFFGYYDHICGMTVGAAAAACPRAAQAESSRPPHLEACGVQLPCTFAEWTAPLDC